MRRTATLLSLVALALVLGSGPALAAPACQGEALSLRGLNQFLRSQPVDSPLPDTIGAGNRAFAQEFGGLRFGPVARSLTAGCR